MAKGKEVVGKMSFVDHVEAASQRRLINGEYQRGFMEGYHKAVIEVGGALDGLLTRFDGVATAGRYDFKTQAESFSQP